MPAPGPAAINHPRVGATTGPESTIEQWKASADLMLGYLPTSARWAIGSAIAVGLLVILGAVIDSAPHSSPDAALRPPPSTTDDGLDIPIDVADDSAPTGNTAFDALSDEDQSTCGEVNRRFDLATDDGDLEESELTDVVDYAYRFSDYGGRLEAAAVDLREAMATAQFDPTHADEIVSAGQTLLYVCNYGG